MISGQNQGKIGKEQEKEDRGDIPQTVVGNVDAVSMVSSFSEDTQLMDIWKKPTSDLLGRFSQARKRTDVDFKARLQEQRAKATALFEA